MEIKLSGSVGAGGVNKPAEVSAIQVALNRWRATQAMPGIGVDGSIGGESIGAIKHFQKTQFGWSDPDGRFDPQGNSLKNLNAFLTGPTRRLLEPVQTFRRGVITIEMGDDGEIVVRPGDWPSRYALAIYGDPFKFQTFVRINHIGLSLVVHPTAGPLRVGESIYDYTQLLKFAAKNNMPLPKAPPPAPPLDKSKQEKIIEKILHDDYNIKGEESKYLAGFLSNMGIAGNLADAIDIAASLVSHSQIFEGIATVFGFAGIIVSFADSCVTLVNLSNTHAKFAAYRGLAYAQTAWAFDAPVPAFSPYLRNNMSSGLSQRDREVAQAEWIRVTKLATDKLQGSFRYPKRAKIAKAMMRDRFENSPAKMCLEAMKALEGKFDYGIQRNIWKNGYQELYPR